MIESVKLAEMIQATLLLQMLVPAYSAKLEAIQVEEVQPQEILAHNVLQVFLVMATQNKLSALVEALLLLEVIAVAF